MAVTTLTHLWQMAATFMGEKGVNVILDATTPTTPVEITFNAIYDEIRLEHLKRLKPDFAKKSAQMYDAPTRNFDLDETFFARVTNARWKYGYRQPTDSIKFLGFVQDQMDLAGRDTQRKSIYRNPWKMINLPVSYLTDDAIALAPHYDLTLAGLLYIYPGTMRVVIRDPNNGRLHTVGDAPDGTFDSDGGTNFNLYPRDDETGVLDTDTPLIVSATDRTYAKVNDLIFRFTDVLDSAGHDWALSTSPATIDFQYGVQVSPGPENSGPSEGAAVSYVPHVFTDLQDAEAIFLYDSTDITDWSTEFIVSVAHELARRGAMVHTKSPRVVQQLNGEKQRADFMLIDSESENDDGSLDQSEMSTTEQDRL